MDKTKNREVFETMPVSAALYKMAIPTIISQLITLIYNIADTWFIGKTNNPYMVAASSLVLTVYMITIVLGNLFGVGGGTLMVRLMGRGRTEEADKVASMSLIFSALAALLFSLSCLLAMNPLLRLLGASDNTIVYARQYLFFVVVLGATPAVLSNVMSTMVRNVGFSKKAGLGMSMGGILNVLLDPLFMFVLLPEGYEVVGAALATLLSNIVVLVYFIVTYTRIRDNCVLHLPSRIERLEKASLRSMFAVGVPAATGTLLFDITNMLINRMSAAHGDLQLAAMGIVLKVERLPLNIGIGICLGMVPLVAYNYASGNRERMKKFFTTARRAGLSVALVSVVMYWLAAPAIMKAFIADAETVALGTQFLKARCFATPVMFLSFQMVHFMQAINQGKAAFWMPVIRQIALNIPMLLVLNRLFGMQGIIWTQVSADILNVAASYAIYYRVRKRVRLYEPVGKIL